jgi:uncharacterized protein (UPF0212 family)
LTQAVLILERIKRESMSAEEVDDISIHIDGSDKRKDIPDITGQTHCPACNSELQSGFGLAGGGYGVYMYCEKCERVVEKTFVDE